MTGIDAHAVRAASTWKECDTDTSGYRQLSLDASGSISILNPMGNVRHIAIAGNMGVGKSTLTAALAADLHADAFYETVDDHPYLERYYQDMQRWAFQSQFFFLSQAFSQHCEIAHSANVCIQDRTIYEHFHVFASSLHGQGLLGDDDIHVLGKHYESLVTSVPPPDLMVYLRASVPTLQSRIATRDRSIEQSVDAGYLAALEKHYETWMSNYDVSNVLIIDTDTIDIHNDEQRAAVLQLIRERVEAPAGVLGAKSPFSRMQQQPALATAAL